MISRNMNIRMLFLRTVLLLSMGASVVVSVFGPWLLYMMIRTLKLQIHAPSLKLAQHILLLCYI